MTNEPKNNTLLRDLSPKLSEMLLCRNLSEKRFRCHTNNTPDLLVDVAYQDGIVATAFIRMSDVDLGYTKIDVFKGDQYIGHTGVVIHFDAKEVSDPNDYGRAALPSIRVAIEQMFQQTEQSLMDRVVQTQSTVTDAFVRKYVKRSMGNDFSVRDAYALYIKHLDEFNRDYLDEKTFNHSLDRSMALEYKAIGRVSQHGVYTYVFRGFKLTE